MVLSRRSTRSAGVLICLLLILTACRGLTDTPTPTPEPTIAPGVTPAPTVAPTPTPPDAGSGGTLIVALPREPDSLNFTLTDGLPARWAISALNARMIRITDRGSYQAQLLERVPSHANGGISADGLVWTLEFRPDLIWSDGDPLDGNDFAFTWRTITDPDYPAAFTDGWDAIEDVELAGDDLTVTVTLTTPVADFIDRVLVGTSDNGRGFLLPAHLFEDMTAEEIARALYGGEEHVGNGAFVLRQWEPGEQMVLERNEQYFGPRPRLERLIFRFVPDLHDAVIALNTGEIDVVPDLPETALVELSQLPDISTQRTPKGGAVLMLGFNLNDPANLDEPHPILADAAVREAIALGFDREAIIEQLIHAPFEPAATPLAGTPWAALDLEPYPFDPNRARQLLDDAGWQLQPDGVRQRDGVRLRLTQTTVLGDSPVDALNQRIFAAFASDMAAIGVEIEQVILTAAQSGQADGESGIVPQRRFDIVTIDDSQRAGVDQFQRRFASDYIPTPENPRGGNVMGYRHPEVDRLLREQATTIDPVQRQELLDEAQRRVYEDLPVVPVFLHSEITASQSYVLGLKPGPWSGLWWNVEAWWVDREGVAP